MDAFEKLGALAELERSRCELFHLHGSTNPAVNYITIPIGKTENDVEEQDKEFVIPICQECLDAISSDEWCLLYCMDCNDSRWVAHEMSKLKFHHKKTGHKYNILLSLGCPECSNKPRGLYFPDSEMWVI